MRVTVHFPETKQGKENLKNAVANVHINAVLKYVSNLNCPKEQKEKLLGGIIKDNNY